MRIVFFVSLFLTTPWGSGIIAWPITTEAVMLFVAICLLWYSLFLLEQSRCTPSQSSRYG